ncbi:hypothetical protein, partial [Oceanobacillus oncorhynchi]|uniref:hypothetical protein n=1 Tax=Oceanobacillus oncorhynchi TaxID=545501 RepID=UPI001D022AF5
TFAKCSSWQKLAEERAPRQTNVATSWGCDYSPHRKHLYVGKQNDPPQRCFTLHLLFFVKAVIEGTINSCFYRNEVIF